MRGMRSGKECTIGGDEVGRGVHSRGDEVGGGGVHYRGDEVGGGVHD